MSGRRCKALRRAFQKKHGRPPELTRMSAGVRLGKLWLPSVREASEWRRLKKRHGRDRRRLDR